jgi:IS5 family transposase
VVAAEGPTRPKKPETNGGRRSVARQAGLDHQPEARAGAARCQDSLGLHREIAALYSNKGRPAIANRFLIGLSRVKHICGLSDEGVSDR